MTALGITVAALILCYPLSLIADALRDVAEAIRGDADRPERSLWR